MNAALRIAREEWRLWARSRVVLFAALIVALLMAVTSTLTALRLGDEAKARTARQISAEETFLAQPDRHPHRMVHYGHYAFRAPPPLAAFDPGVDAVTGQSIFLEGHRQNTAMFADTRAGADLGGFAALTPANIYQLLMPLLLIIVGHGVMLRERESRTLAVLLAQGQSGLVLAGGKALALTGVVGLFLLPVAALAAYGVAAGEPPLTAALMLMGYALYLAVWTALVLAVSLWVRQRSVALGVLIFAWLLIALVVPRIGINAGSSAIDAPGKIESDLAMLSQQRKLGDGHNAADPAFAALQKQVLEQYGVANIEQLPMNWRGVVAGYSEAKLTRLMNDYAANRMAQEAAQSRIVTLFGIASPTLAIGAASRNLTGTDLATHHRFLRQSEALRFDFVQALNGLHASELSFADDAKRSSDPEAERRTRVNASAWALLDEFRFVPDPAAERAKRAALPLAMLLGWLALLGGVIVAGAKRLRP